jgi:serine/threonine protein phosphatase PrpC
LNIEALGITDVGRERSENQDSFMAEIFRSARGGNGLLTVVADGVGGALAGGTASRIAVDTIKETIFRTGRAEDLETAIQLANQKIHEISSTDESHRGMATTCTAMVMTEDHAIVGHVGDSRAYVMRNGTIELMTEDHTVVRRLLRDRVISEDEAQHHPQRHVLTRALGASKDISVDIHEISLKEGDTYLICSDGLYKYFSNEELLIATKTSLMKDLPEHLVATAKERGGDDNITVVVINTNAADTDGDKTVRIIGHGSLPEKSRKPVYAWLFATITALCAALYLISYWHGR